MLSTIDLVKDTNVPWLNNQSDGHSRPRRVGQRQAARNPYITSIACGKRKYESTLSCLSNLDRSLLVDLVAGARKGAPNGLLASVLQLPCLLAADGVELEVLRVARDAAA